MIEFIDVLETEFRLEENPDIKDENCIEFYEALKERFINDEFNSYYGNPSLTDYARNR